MRRRLWDMQTENRLLEDRVIDGYGTWLLDRMDSTDHSYLLTFLFRPCHGSEKHRVEVMRAGIEVFYRKLACACVRHPRSRMSRDLLPLLVGFPDWPVPKAEKTSVAEASINDGLHYHAIAIIRDRCRLNVPLHAHLRDYKELYVDGNTPLFRVRADLVQDPARQLTDYLFKQAARKRFSSDDVLLLPKSWSELHSSDRARS